MIGERLSSDAIFRAFAALLLLGVVTVQHGSPLGSGGQADATVLRQVPIEPGFSTHRPR